MTCGFKMGSDVYGLPSQETYLDSQNYCSDAAKIRTISETCKLFPLFNTQASSAVPITNQTHRMKRWGWLDIIAMIWKTTAYLAIAMKHAPMATRA